MKRRLRALAALLLLSAGTAFSASSVPDILPAPQSITMGKGSFKVRGTTVNCDNTLDARTQKAIMTFADRLSEACGKTVSFAATPSLRASADKGLVRGIVFVPANGMGEEAYIITVRSKAVVVEASSRKGFLYALQTLRQMLPAAIYGAEPAPKEKWSLPCCTIVDSPRYAYRGMHLDCCRHFFSVAEVKKYLDIMAMYKMNTFHWHITEDQGWRVEIDKYPLLTEIGAYRKGTQIGKDRTSSDGVRYGGYYTKAQIRELVAYADDLGITIIPEVDLPGHMQAALASYPELGCAGSKPQPYEVWTRWGVSRQVLCVGKESTMRFLEDVVDEVADLFPGEYFHIGGDECPTDEWKTDPDCQAKIKELGLVSDDKASAEDRLQNYVTARIQAHLAKKGKKIIGWDEILKGELAPGATVMSWRGSKGGIEAAKAGYDVIMTANKNLYFDYYQLKDISAQPLGIGHYLPLSTVYSFNPEEGLSPDEARHIKGVQANLWTEYIATPEHLEYMLLPRMFAVCELQWCQPARKDFARIEASIERHQTKILEILGYNYCKTWE